LHLTGMDESFMKPEECRHPNTGLKPVYDSSVVTGVDLCVSRCRYRKLNRHGRLVLCV
jgi:hypothetical protein